MAEMTASVLLTLKDRLTAQMKKVVGTVKQLKGEMKSVKASAPGNDLGRGFDRAEVKARALRIEMARLKTSMDKIRGAGKGLLQRGFLGGAALVAGKGVMASSMIATMLGPAIEMEQFRTQLKNLEGSSAGAQKAMAWITQFAKDTPLELADCVKAYVALKNVGMDPTNGSMQAMVDTMARSGKGVENLDSIVRALTQAWTKNKLQGEEAMQLSEAGVPVWDILGKKMHKKPEQVQQMASDGELGKREIGMLIEAMGEQAKGASKDFSTSWTGIMSNISDSWYQFRVAVMDSGPFQELKSNLQGILDTINKMAADGSLKAFAERVGKDLTETIRNAASVAKTLWAVGLKVASAIDTIAIAAGGYENLTLLAVALVSVGSALKMIVACAEAVAVLKGVVALGGFGALGGGAAVAGGAALAGGAAAAGGTGAAAGGALAAGGLVAAGKTALAAAGRLAGGIGVLYVAMSEIDQRQDGWIASLQALVPARKQADGSFRQRDIAPPKDWWKAPTTRLAETLGALGHEYVMQFIDEAGAGIKSLGAQTATAIRQLGFAIQNAIESASGGLNGLGGLGAGPSRATPEQEQDWQARQGAPVHTLTSPANSTNYPKRAYGGSVFGGQSYMVGERGPEIITPGRYGHVTPIGNPSGRGGARGDVHINFGTVTIGAGADRGTLNQLASMIRAKLESALHDGAYA